MIDSRFVVSDDHPMDFLVFGEVAEKRFTLFRMHHHFTAAFHRVQEGALAMSI